MEEESQEILSNLLPQLPAYMQKTWEEDSESSNSKINNDNDDTSGLIRLMEVEDVPMNNIHP